MTPIAASRPSAAGPLTKPVYLILVIALWLTGMAQLPIMKRYYVSDIPGLGWLADFYATHLVHYIAASLLLFVVIYAMVVYLAAERRGFKPTPLAVVRAAVLAVLVISGIFRVWKNLPDVVFSPGFIQTLDYVHLGMAMVLMLTGVYALITRGRWLAQRRRF